MTLASECGRGHCSYFCAFLSQILDVCIGFSLVTCKSSEKKEASFYHGRRVRKKLSLISTYYIVLYGDTEVSQLSAVLYLLMIVSCPKLNVKYISYADSHRFHLLVLTGLC